MLQNAGFVKFGGLMVAEYEVCEVFPFHDSICLLRLNFMTLLFQITSVPIYSPTSTTIRHWGYPRTSRTSPPLCRIVWDLQCEGVVVYGTCSVWGLQCVGLAVFKGRSVWDLSFIGVGSCVWVSFFTIA